MSNLANPFDSIISQASQAPKKTGISDKKAKPHQPKTGFLLDTSGSMKENVGRYTKIDMLWRAIAPILTPNITLVEFNSVASRVTDIRLLEAGGGTAMHLGLTVSLGLGVRSLLVVSDGLPDDETQALDIASQYQGQINTLYIGPDDNSRAIEFMRHLANVGQVKGCSEAYGMDKKTTVNQFSGVIQKLLPQA